MYFLDFKIRDIENKARVSYEKLSSVVSKKEDYFRVNPEHCILIIRTGLKDMNNRDVFLGDILLRNDLYHTVEYDSSGAFIAFDGEESYYFSEFFGFEVVGNIFDNPELAKNIEEHNRNVLSNKQTK